MCPDAPRTITATGCVDQQAFAHPGASSAISKATTYPPPSNTPVAAVELTLRPRHLGLPPGACRTRRDMPFLRSTASKCA